MFNYNSGIVSGAVFFKKTAFTIAFQDMLLYIPGGKYVKSEASMLDFLIGMVAGHLLTQSNGSGNAAERLYEQAQTKVLIDIVNTAAEIEKADPSPEELELQLRPLKMMFDRIDYSGIKSPEGQTVYRQVQDYFIENGVV